CSELPYDTPVVFVDRAKLLTPYFKKVDGILYYGEFEGWTHCVELEDLYHTVFCFPDDQQICMALGLVKDKNEFSSHCALAKIDYIYFNSRNEPANYEWSPFGTKRRCVVLH